jgi:hypothetical protein
VKPLRQTTKHGVVEILSDGTVFLDFVGEHYGLHILPNNHKVCLAQPRGNNGIFIPLQGCVVS